MPTPTIPGLRRWTKVKSGPGMRPGYTYRLRGRPGTEFFIFALPNRASDGPIVSYYVTDGTRMIAEGCRTKSDCIAGVRKYLRARPRENPEGQQERPLTFRDIAVGEEFEFLGTEQFPTSGLARGPWVKRTVRTYEHIDDVGKPPDERRYGGSRVQVGSVAAPVFRSHHSSPAGGRARRANCDRGGETLVGSTGVAPNPLTADEDAHVFGQSQVHRQWRDEERRDAKQAARSGNTRAAREAALAAAEHQGAAEAYEAVSYTYGPLGWAAGQRRRRKRNPSPPKAPRAAAGRPRARKRKPAPGELSGPQRLMLQALTRGTKKKADVLFSEGPTLRALKSRGLAREMKTIWKITAKGRKAIGAAPARTSPKRTAPKRGKPKASRRKSPKRTVCRHTLPLEKGASETVEVCYPEGIFPSLERAVVNIQKELRARFQRLKRAPRITRAEWKFSDGAKTKGCWHFTAKRKK